MFPRYPIKSFFQENADVGVNGLGAGISEK